MVCFTINICDTAAHKKINVDKFVVDVARFFKLKCSILYAIQLPLLEVFYLKLLLFQKNPSLSSPF